MARTFLSELYNIRKKLEKSMSYMTQTTYIIQGFQYDIACWYCTYWYACCIVRLYYIGHGFLKFSV